MHGVNLDQLGRRDPLALRDADADRARAADRRGGGRAGARAALLPDQPRGRVRRASARLEGLADGIVLNPGAWTHYSYAIRDALELTGLPAVEVHLSDVDSREPWRRESVIPTCASPGSPARGRAATVRRSSACERSSPEMSDRADRLVELLPEAGVDLLLVTSLVNVRYLTGYTGSNGLALVGPDTRAVRDRLSLRRAGGGRGRSRRFERRRDQLGPARRRSATRCPAASCGWASRTPTSPSAQHAPAARAAARAGRAGRGRRAGRAAAGGQGRRTRSSGSAAATELADAALDRAARAGAGRAHRARGGGRARAGDAPTAGAERPVV